jgi:glyoxylase-like metal-dependent hydrolase (beta-lactamase superfamily II)
MPAFAEDARQIGPSLKKVLDRQPKMIYPTHGDPCETAAIRKRMARLIG